VIVLVIDKDHVFAIERKCQPPITVDFDGPMAGEFSLQWMQVVARCIHISGLVCHVQRGKEPSQPCGMHWLNASLGACFREEFQTLVTIAPNHPYSVYEHYTQRKDRSLEAQCALLGVP
jgi:hypothetical protein